MSGSGGSASPGGDRLERVGECDRQHPAGRRGGAARAEHRARGRPARRGAGRPASRAIASANGRCRRRASGRRPCSARDRKALGPGPRRERAHELGSASIAARPRTRERARSSADAAGARARCRARARRRPRPARARARGRPCRRRTRRRATRVGHGGAVTALLCRRRSATGRSTRRGPTPAARERTPRSPALLRPEAREARRGLLEVVARHDRPPLARRRGAAAARPAGDPT